MSSEVAPEGAPVVKDAVSTTPAEQPPSGACPSAELSSSRPPFLDTIAARKPRRAVKQTVDLYVNANKASITRLVKKDRKKDLLGELADWKTYAAGLPEHAGLYFPNLSMRDSYETVAAEHARIASALGFEMSDDEDGAPASAGAGAAADDSVDGDSSYYTGASEDESRGDMDEDSEDDDDEDDEDDDEEDDEDDEDEEGEDEEEEDDDEDDEEESVKGNHGGAKRARLSDDEDEL